MLFFIFIATLISLPHLMDIRKLLKEHGRKLDGKLLGEIVIAAKDKPSNETKCKCDKHS